MTVQFCALAIDVVDLNSAVKAYNLLSFASQPIVIDVDLVQ